MPSTLSRRAVINQFFTIFLPVAVIGAAMGISLYASHAKTQRVLLEASERHQVKIQENSIARDFRSIVADLLVQAAHHEFHQVFTGQAVAPLGSEYLTFAQKKGLYDQVRFLDGAGMEIVRVNYNDGKPFIVPDEDLQSKAAHTYFQNTVQLEAGDLYVSPFDLNIERGTIEQPLKPIIRFGTPVFDRQGRKRGIVVLNYLGAHLIQNFIAVQGNSSGQMMLLNNEGYWLHGPRPEDEWGFMYADRKHRTFGHAFPEAWQRIIDADSGQFYDANGLSTFTTMYPLLDVMKSSRSTSQGFNDHAFHPPARDYAWKIVSRVSPDILEAQIHPLQSRLMMLAAGLIVLLALGSWFLARARVSRKQAQEALAESHARSRTILDTAVDGIITIDAQGIIESCNSAATRMFGYNAEEVLGKKVNLLMPSPHDRQHDEYIARYLQTGEARIIGKGREVEGRRKDGAVFPLELAVSEICVGGRQLFTGIMLDISDRKKAEKEREQLISALEVKNAEMEQFTYTVSHDLKSPLITIQGFLGLLEKDVAARDAVRMKDDMERIRSAAKTMHQLLQDLLELARIGQVVKPPGEVFVSELVREALELCTGQITEQGVRVDISPDLPAVWGDRFRLVEVFQNLIDNAIKFIGDQVAPRIEIGSKPSPRDPRGTLGLTLDLEKDPVFYVRDNGVGIDPRFHDKVFDLFERLDPKIQGTGIGLALVKRIVEQHGGRIWVESEGLGRGCAFCFTLPAQEGDEHGVQ